MEDMLDIMRPLSRLELELEEIRKAHFKELDELFYGVKTKDAKPVDSTPAQSEGSSVTPQQTKKRPKRLTALTENTDETEDAADVTADSSGRQSARLSNSQLLAIAEDDNLNSTASLMPPPPAPTPSDTTMSSGRPQRAAKLKSEKLLKEPSLNRKMRRPSDEEMIRVKVESDHRASQFNRSGIKAQNVAPVAEPTAVEEPLPEAAAVTTPPVVPIEKPVEIPVSQNLRVKIKREKLTGELPPPPPPADVTTTILETDATRTDETVVSNTTTASEMSKKGRKKKKDPCHRPIKVERFSEIDQNSPVSSRTRKNSTESRTQERSIYKDALEEPPIEEQQQTPMAAAAVVNETMTVWNATMVLGPAPTDESPITAPADATFEVIPSKMVSQMPESGPARESLLTEDESLDDRVPMAKFLSNVKTIKLPGRPHELFNPLLQSPVKMRVEAFENAALAQSKLRAPRAKDVGTPGSNNTPKIGRLQLPTVGRFYTPTQTTSALPLSAAPAKKAPLSASKATTLLKTATGTNLKSTNSTSSKTLSRENSGDDFRKGLHNLAEERKKLREQKHQQAAQQREAKEQERAERLAKQAAERAKVRERKKLEERKRLEMEERKRLELEELNRKMRQQEAAEALKKAKLRELEHQKLAQLTGAKKKMLPPPPKTKYTWDMLHEDDSTDDEGKVSHKRPPAPTWSRSHVRREAITMQSHCPTDVIDSFFSVAPTTPDLKQIFPNIDPSQLKRNSSVHWSTPPRYSELPKY
ncbi:BRCA2-interacting transcriptional repressor EMSY [Drosophila obscura]|uniref:BRCA2-interacting transcriptional repressor EMSY n=1 Tax=Drosophila obscura TaxID=7282 RepID=UPI001BB164FF|nr:BRCA2-interacting transcriptional repressor EMSY [Drosophila obscura]